MFYSLCSKPSLDYRHTYREYEESSKSSKYDVLIDDFYKRKNYEKRRFSTIRTIRSPTRVDNHKAFRESIYNPNSSNSELSESEQDNVTTTTFYYHKKIYVFAKDSCNYFNKNSKLRQFCVWLTESKYFNYIIIIIILVHSVLLGGYDYKNPEADFIFNNVMNNSENIVVALYTLEMILKIIARGLYQEKNCYLRKIMNIVDSFVVMFGILSFQYNNMKYFGILRLFRLLVVFKKFRLFNRLKIFSQILINSFWHIITIAIFLILSLFLFSVIGLNLWLGKLNYLCRLNNAPINGTWARNTTENHLCGVGYKCFANETCGSDFDVNSDIYGNHVSGDFNDNLRFKEINWGFTNFDNIAKSLSTSFIIYTIESWQEVLFILFDAVGKIAPIIYCIVLILISSFLLGNMVVATMIDNFAKDFEKNRGDLENIVDYSNLLNNDANKKRKGLNVFFPLDFYNIIFYRLILLEV